MGDQVKLLTWSSENTDERAGLLPVGDRREDKGKQTILLDFV